MHRRSLVTTPGNGSHRCFFLISLLSAQRPLLGASRVAVTLCYASQVSRGLVEGPSTVGVAWPQGDSSPQPRMKDGELSTDHRFSLSIKALSFKFSPPILRVQFFRSWLSITTNADDRSEPEVTSWTSCHGPAARASNHTRVRTSPPRGYSSFLFIMQTFTCWSGVIACQAIGRPSTHSEFSRHS